METTLKLLTLALALLASVEASAYSFAQDGIYYNILSETDNTLEVTYLDYYSGDYEGDIAIPSEVDYLNSTYTVTAIGEAAFSTCSNLNSITLPKTLLTIGINLSSITLPASLTTIDNYTFSSCSKLSSVTLPEALTTIGFGAFSYCSNLTSISIPESTTTIGGSAFSTCTKLVSISIPNSVTSIGNSAFANCNAITQIEIKKENPLNCTPGFTNYVYQNATLYVPAGSRSAYESTAPWSNFSNIVERVFTGINITEAASNAKPEITVNNGTIYVNGLADNAPVTILDINGRVVYSGTEHRLNNLVPGLYIVKAGNHTVKAAL